MAIARSLLLASVMLLTACGGGDQPQGVFDGAMQRASGRVEKHAAIAAFEQFHPQRLFDGTHGPTDRAVREVKLFAGTREALQARGGFETTQRGQRRKASGNR